MKNRSFALLPLKVLGVLFVVACVFYSGAAAAQKGINLSDPSTWPEAVKAAPGNHKVLYEDNDIRFLSVTIPAHSKEPLHGHPWSSVKIVDKGGSGGIDHIYGGPDIPIPAPTPKSMVPVVIAQGPEAPHQQENTGDTDQHLYRVEFKHGDKIFKNVPREPIPLVLPDGFQSKN